MIHAELVALALVVAPLVFVTVGFISRNPAAPKRILQSMGLLVIVGLAIGLISPALGASAGFGAGIAITLRMPELVGQLRLRIIGIAFSLAYMLLLLVIATPAGLFTGAVLPSLMIGFADEYGIWRYRRADQAS